MIQEKTQEKKKEQTLGEIVAELDSIAQDFISFLDFHISQCREFTQTIEKYKNK